MAAWDEAAVHSILIALCLRPHVYMFRVQYSNLSHPYKSSQSASCWAKSNHAL